MLRGRGCASLTRQGPSWAVLPPGSGRTKGRAGGTVPTRNPAAAVLLLLSVCCTPRSGRCDRRLQSGRRQQLLRLRMSPPACECWIGFSQVCVGVGQACCCSSRMLFGECNALLSLLTMSSISMCMGKELSSHQAGHSGSGLAGQACFPGPQGLNRHQL